MPSLSPTRAAVPLLEGLPPPRRGKVRDTYDLPDNNLLQVATDGISIFDFVLNALVPKKGTILNALSYFWMTYLMQFGFKTHLVAAGRGIDLYLPEHLRGNPQLQAQATVIRKLNMAPIEFIARAVLTGSSLKSYREAGMVCGHALPPGLQDGDTLPCILDTPTTKAQEGHDENLSSDEVRRQYPEHTYELIRACQIVAKHARSRGILLADTKLEFSMEGTLCDEAFTPDSSRYWELKTWKQGRKIEDRKAPPPFDKQLVRQWGLMNGINLLDPANIEDVAKAHSFEIPSELIQRTAQTYRYIFWRLTGQKIEQYLRSTLGVDIQEEHPKIAVICGSDSDLPIISAVVARARINVHVMSCHRNPEELRQFAEAGCRGADIAIGIGSKALALPGILDSWLHYYRRDIPVIGVALGDPRSKAFKAACLSIEELPGTPVIMDEMAGKCYRGPKGLAKALNRAFYGEIPPSEARKSKPVQMDILKSF